MVEQSVQSTSRWYGRAIGLLIVVALAGLGAWMSATGSAGVAQTKEDGQVTIAATLQARGAAPIFTIAMNTHAVDLDGYDLKQLALLRIDSEREVQPTSWEAPKGGHHRSGTLTFPATDANGTSLIASGARTVELVIRDVAGVPERRFRWTFER